MRKLRGKRGRIVRIFDVVRRVRRYIANIVGTEVHRARIIVGKARRHPTLPAIRNCHSDACGCQCSSRIPPGLMVTRAAATCVETESFASPRREPRHPSCSW